MKKIGIPIICMIIIIIYSGFSMQKSPQALTPKENKLLISIVTNYYNAIKSKNYAQALSYVEFQSNNLNTEFNQRSVALKELNENMGYSIKLERIVNESPVVDANTNKYSVSSVIKVDYKNCNTGDINENFQLNKINGKWKIEKIESPDRYVPLRSNQFVYMTAPDFLLPKLK